MLAPGPHQQNPALETAAVVVSCGNALAVSRIHVGVNCEQMLV